MNNYNKLLEHYKKNHEKRIFFERVELNESRFSIMYIYDKETELDSFKKSFGYYLPIFVKNEDNLSSMYFNDDIDGDLIKQSYKIWKSSTIMPHRKTQVNGIFGELFLDVYLRIVENRDIMMSYASRRSFDSNFESTGIDNIAYIINDGEVELYLAEAKFVADKNAAKSSLLSDISVGSNAHLTEEYLNRYFSFVLEKDVTSKAEDREIIKSFYLNLNKELNNTDKSFIHIVKERLIKLNFICFAIFNGPYNNPLQIKEIYDELSREIVKQYKSMGIENYSYEIVFIPTNSKSTKIKEEIEGFLSE